jgi:hypothetical protein
MTYNRWHIASLLCSHRNHLALLGLPRVSRADGYAWALNGTTVMYGYR